MGHDTLSANLMLGHGADERRYEVAAAILQDLGMTKPVGDIPGQRELLPPHRTELVFSPLAL